MGAIQRTFLCLGSEQEFCIALVFSRWCYVPLYPLSLLGTSWLNADVHYCCSWSTHFFSEGVLKACKALPNRSSAWCVSRMITLCAKKKKLVNFTKCLHFICHARYRETCNVSCREITNPIWKQSEGTILMLPRGWWISDCAEEGAFQCLQADGFSFVASKRED